MGKAARKDWLDRALEAADSNPAAQAEASALIARMLTRIKPTAPYHPPLDMDGAPTLRVTFEPVDVEAPEPRGNHVTMWGEGQAGLRAYLTDALEWGRENFRMVALVMEDGAPRTVILEGRESAVRQAFPDEQMLRAWLAAGATALPIVTNEPHPLFPGRRMARWVPIAWAPRALQQELPGREAIALP